MTPKATPESLAEAGVEDSTVFSRMTPGEQADYRARVDQARADAKAGRTLPLEAVRDWLLSWGTDKELPPPECP